MTFSKSGTIIFVFMTNNFCKVILQLLGICIRMVYTQYRYKSLTSPYRIYCSVNLFLLCLLLKFLLDSEVTLDVYKRQLYNCLDDSCRVSSAVLLYLGSHLFEVVFSVINGMPRSAI